MICVVDYGVSNLGSMRNMLRRIGAEPEFAATGAALMRADKIILPGIGAFDHGMQELERRGLVAPIRAKVEQGTPLLGVCLGMQLLGRGSTEGTEEGLGLLDARCERLTADPARGVRVPHMGWCHLDYLRSVPLLHNLGAESRYYFVHSYHLICADPADVLATAAYGTRFTAMVQRANIYGAQFHPEKSHRFGMRLLQNFVEL